jgi:uncharacterized membrane protein
MRPIWLAGAISLSACAISGTDLSRGEDAISSGRIPCRPAAVLRAVCQQCHANPPQNGAPIPLVTFADTRADRRGRPAHEVMLEAVETRWMPQSPVTITDAQRQALLDWLRAGAPSAAPEDACPDAPR